MKFKRKPEWWVWLLVIVWFLITMFFITITSQANISKINSTIRVNDPVYTLFKQRCSMCHAINQKLIGPSFNDVSKRYKGADNTKISILARKIREGGVGSWGVIPMPPNSVTRSESELLVRWILRLPKIDV
tara:strand:- start:1077 stop:1469 length:393 start_codon:yes stop_codon:yes gene_type:complete